MQDGLYKAVILSVIGNVIAIVMIAVRAGGPAVIGGFDRNVQLIAARRAMLDFPQASIRIPIHAEDIAVAP